MESVTDCWLCRLVIDLSGERCFSQAATVLWKPQARGGGGSGEEIKIKRWCLTWKFGPQKTTKHPWRYPPKLFFYWRWTDTGQKVATQIIVGIMLINRFRVKWSVPTRSRSAPLLAGIRFCSTSHRGMLQLMDFRSSGWKRHDENKLETACRDRSGSAGDAFCGQRGGTSILWKQEPILFKW